LSSPFNRERRGTHRYGACLPPHTSGRPRSITPIHLSYLPIDLGYVIEPPFAPPVRGRRPAAQLLTGGQGLAPEPAGHFQRGTRFRGTDRQPPVGAGRTGRYDPDRGRQPLDAPRC